MRVEARADDGSIAVAHTPQQESERLAFERGAIGECREILTDELRLGVVLLELHPLDLPRQLAQLAHEAREVVGGMRGRHAV
jgi:hypothetical protein